MSVTKIEALSCAWVSCRCSMEKNPFINDEFENFQQDKLTLIGMVITVFKSCWQNAKRSSLRALVSLAIVLLLCACTGGTDDWRSQTAMQGSASGQVAAVAAASPTPSAPASPDASPTPPSTVRAPSATSPPTLTPTLIPTATPLACWSQGGRFVYDSLRSDLLPLPMEYSVYLPPCYDQQPERRYPVLYMIHGMNYNNDQWDRLGADETADALVAAGELPPFIIVMPRDRSWTQPEEDPFGQVLADSLVPTIDARFRTLPEREYRAIGGLSRGAGWAVHLGFSHWELFGAIGGHSLPVFWSDTGRIRGWLSAIPPGSMPRIYLDIGEKDRQSIMQSAVWFENLLNETGIPHEWHLFPGYHEEAYWHAHIEEYLRWYAAAW